jgi:3-phenylpropionate/trans-cinnamate dioxygenase ferredoxin reductase component
VIGGGWIGLEVTAAARQAGLQVTVLENLELPLLRVLGREMAQVFADLHRSQGVSLRLGVRIEGISSSGGTATGVQLTDGTRIEADAVVAGIGAAPRIGLAADAGLEVTDGIVTTAALRTSDPDIFAAGDVASAYHPLLGRHIRVVEYLGDVRDGYDQVVVRGDVDGREFIAFWLKDGRVLAGMNVNVWGVTDSIKNLIRSGHPVTAEALADASTPLDDLAAG